jgi:hypothetical protein
MAPRRGHCMTDDRENSSRGKESRARTTARDVPFVRGAGAESEPAPRGQRPDQLPRDPTYEAELAQVELAVMRDPARRDDPSTKQGGGRRAHEFTAGLPPESVTPESPGARTRGEGRSPEPPSSSGRSVASGTLLSVGAVDPRGKTERTLETPRMFFSRPDDGAEAYFKPGKIPAVTVHQTLETETVKLADSIDPRRAKTMPRIDRATLARLAELEGEPDSESPFAASQPASEFDLGRPASEPDSWSQQDYEAASSLGERGHDGQIHASLSPFRDQGEPSFSLEGVATRPEPYVARLASEPPPTPPMPDPDVIPTQRDLPQHRIEASRPPPAPLAPPPSLRAPSDSAAPLSEAVSPTTASIAAEGSPRRTTWLNYAAFAVALLLAVALGLLLTDGSKPEQASRLGAKSVPLPAKVAEPPSTPRAPQTLAPGAPIAPVEARPLSSSRSAPASTPGRPPAAAASPVKPLATTPLSPAAAPAVSVRKSAPTKPPRETIF